MYEIQNLYEENISINQLELLLVDSRILYYAFILHDKDINSNGEPKKHHYHLIIDFDDNTHHKLERVKTFFKDYTCRIKNVTNVKKFHRYLTHKDNKEKYQYNDCEVYTSDIDMYNDFISISLKLSNTDLFLKDYFEFCVTDFFEFDNTLTFDNTRSYFISYGKIDYYMKYRDKIFILATEYLDEYIRYYNMVICILKTFSLKLLLK